MAERTVAATTEGHLDTLAGAAVGRSGAGRLRIVAISPGDWDRICWPRVRRFGGCGRG